MTRACETCEWGRDELGEAARLACREGPDPIPVARQHWCGRWRLAERLADGRDRRPQR